MQRAGAGSHPLNCFWLTAASLAARKAFAGLRATPGPGIAWWRYISPIQPRGWGRGRFRTRRWLLMDGKSNHFMPCLPVLLRCSPTNTIIVPLQVQYTSTFSHWHTFGNERREFEMFSCCAAFICSLPGIKENSSLRQIGYVTHQSFFDICRIT